MGDVGRFAVTLNGLYFDDEADPLRQSLRSLRPGHHLLLVGPPWKRKRKIAEILCRHSVADSYAMATATANWSTFDTIGGSRRRSDDALESKAGISPGPFWGESGRRTNESTRRD